MWVPPDSLFLWFGNRAFFFPVISSHR
jgi:hypothetical protein